MSYYILNLIVKNKNINFNKRHSCVLNPGILSRVLELNEDYGFSDRINNSPYKMEWECLFKCQTESGTYSKSPFLLRSAALLNDIMPVVCKRQHILFNKFKTNLSRNVNADNTVGQPSRANVDPISDPSGIG
ncbi:hypothetical protein BCR32DRAFT_298722 [Anaeromyces robustus]|uniref:Uncharacterized protein n=1 Tax=Anaeromyces robustus TaxID=1754192 RepID=A0A1Y1UUU8_9FUNG|nr:hypothetical protein BCR32DRAFT_298722 [Anaeromyces robustus]|eukprot:ORX41734.1 hypothetical protein BCR32DRAFT_298722 [Anaeromyces robustus]